MRRKLSYYAAAMTAGILLTQIIGNIYVICAVSFTCAILFKRIVHVKNFENSNSINRNNNIKYRNLILVFFIIGAAVSVFYTHFFYNGKNSDNLNHTITEKGIVYDIEKKDESKYRIYVVFKNNIISEKAVLNYYKDIKDYYQLTDAVIEFTCELQEAESCSNPNTFDYRQYLKSKGIRYTGVINSFNIISSSNSIIARIKRTVLYRRELFIDELKLSDSNKALIRGILFGDTNQIEEELSEEFRINSTSHVLAVSGLHIGILYGLYQGLRKKSKSRAIVIIFVMMLLIYGTACLWSVSVTRAVALVILKVAGDLLERKYDMFCGLSFIAMIQMVCNPFIIYSTSFQMSYLAVMLITFTLPKLKNSFKGRGIIFAVQLGLMPYMAYTFNYVTFIGLLSNIPVVFLISLVVPTGIIMFFVYFLSGAVLENTETVLEALLNMSVYINHFFANIKYLSFETVSPPKWIIISFYIALFTFCSEEYNIQKLRKNSKQVITYLAAALLVIFIAFGQSDQFRHCDIIMADVGQGDCLHLKYKGSDFLFDGGGKSDFNVGKKILKPYLLKNGCSSIDAAFATHEHTDHFKGIEELAETFDVRNVVTTLKRGDVITIGKNCKVEVLWPEPMTNKNDDENKNSSIYMIYIKGIKILVTGDITEEGERMLLNEYKGTDMLKADILKVAHHGSKYSSCEDFIEAVKPKIALIGVGKKNNYGHPSEETLERLAHNNIEVYRTDYDGAIGVKVTNKTISVITNK